MAGVHKNLFILVLYEDKVKLSDCLMLNV